MVASREEADIISEIILDWVPRKDAQEMMREIWKNVGRNTENESLQQTILLLSDRVK